MRRRRGAGSRAGLLLALVPALSCATAARQDADRRLASGDAAGAAASYESLLEAPFTAGDEDLLLFRTAVAHALADLDGGAPPARSRELLGELLERFPTSPHRPAAQLLLRLSDEIEAGALAGAEARASDAAASGAADSAAAGGADGLAELRHTLVELHRQVDRLVAEARAREEKLGALRAEVEMLKAIDLGAPPAEPPR